MNDESEVRKLLKIRVDLEEKVIQLQEELDSLKAVLVEIDRSIVKQGFRQPKPEEEPLPQPAQQVIEDKSSAIRVSPIADGSSIIAKDGTVLGKITLSNEMIIFTPRDDLKFTLSTPPFQSFLLDRVLSNMRTTDETRSTSGEINPEQILKYDIETDGDIIKSLKVKNYGGERRLREIQSSLRWSLDKMFDKMKKG